MDTTILEKIEKLTPKLFSETIKRIIQQTGLSYQAIKYYCEQNELEIELVAQFIDVNLKGQLRKEFEDLHYLQRKTTAPIG